MNFPHHKSTTKHHKRPFISLVIVVMLSIVSILSLLTIAIISYVVSLDIAYKGKAYPGVFVQNAGVTGKTPDEIKAIWDEKNIPYKRAIFELHLGETIATISGEMLGLGFDSGLVARHAYLIGRSGNTLSDIFTKTIKGKTVISPLFTWNEEMFQTALENLSQSVNEEAHDALFEFKDGRVTSFKAAKPGKQLNRGAAKIQLEQMFSTIPSSPQTIFPIVLTVDTVSPRITTEKANGFGIKERIGMGYSEFSGSIPGRIHNVALAATRLHGVLIPPGGVISYNELLGDVSQATGFQSAYIIKDGRTVLGDGGGVCQVSTTLFRAALAAGLPILERQAHAYRVHFYEDGGFKPGLDATVFAPSVDLKIKNDTPGHILIQAKADTKNLTLVVEFYGTGDGRKAEILNHQILSQTPAPPPLYQDDPTLPKGVVKQVDWAAVGAKTTFLYKVTRGTETLINQQFISTYRPWQAVYLRGTL